MTTRLVPILALQESLRESQDRLSQERRAITSLLPLTEPFTPEAYGQIYLVAERFALKKIKHHLKKMLWLPIQLDPDAEMRMRNMTLLGNWIKRNEKVQPCALDFGNDFVHAVARAALLYGWDDIRVAQLTARIADLFCELSYLVGIVYFTSFLADSALDAIPLTDPQDLPLTVKEFAEFLRKQLPKVITPATEQTFLKPDSAKKDKHAFLHLVVDQPNDTTHKH